MCTKPQVHAHWFEIAILVQELIAASNAECADDDIDGLARRLAQCAQRAIKACRFDGWLVTKHVFHLEGTQRCLNLRSMDFVASALQTFKQDQIADYDVVRIGDRPQFRNCRSGFIAEVRDPNRGIDDDHECASLSRRIASRLPSQPIPAVERIASRRRF